MFSREEGTPEPATAKWPQFDCLILNFIWSVLFDPVESIIVMMEFIMTRQIFEDDMRVS